MARRVRAGRYRMTPRRRAALRKAQLASARKRKRNRRIAIGAGAGVGIAALAGAGVTRHKMSGSQLSMQTGTNMSSITGKQLSGGVRGSYSKLGTGRTASVVVAKGTKKRIISYTHKPLKLGSHTTGKRTPMSKERGLGLPGGKVTVSTARRETIGRTRKVTRDTIPFYNHKVKKSWPHVGAPQSRKINARLREKGLID